MNKEAEAFRNEPNFFEPDERTWLDEGKVEKWFNYSDTVSYKPFLEYLRYLRDADPSYWLEFQPITISRVMTNT